MANFFVSYDLNGPNPTHSEMDEHLGKLNGAAYRVLETVWYIKHSGSANDVYEHARTILSPNDRLLVIEAQRSSWDNLLVPDEVMQSNWQA